MKKTVALCVLLCLCAGLNSCASPAVEGSTSGPPSQPPRETSSSDVSPMALAPCKNGVHEPWEDYIAPALLVYAGEDAYQKWADEREEQGQCADIYNFLFTFDVGYETFTELVGEDAQPYDLQRLIVGVYPYIAANEAEEKLLYELATARADELTTAVKEKIDAYRQGTAIVMENHHPPYPEEFPPASSLPDIRSPQDYILCRRVAKGIGARAYTEGGLYVVVAVDDDHQICLDVVLFGQIDSSNTVIGFGNSGFLAAEGPLGLFDFKDTITAADSLMQS